MKDFPLERFAHPWNHFSLLDKDSYLKPNFCTCLLAYTMKPLCSIKHGGVTQPHSDGKSKKPIANIHTL